MTAATTHSDVRVVIVVDPSLARGLLGNTIATIAIGLGITDDRLDGPFLEDRDGVRFRPSATIPVPVLQATSDALSTLLRRAADGIDDDHAVVPFPAFARSMHDFPTYRTEFARRQLAGEELHGVGLLGTRRWVTSLTGSLKLLS